MGPQREVSNRVAHAEHADDLAVLVEYRESVDEAVGALVVEEAFPDNLAEREPREVRAVEELGVVSEDLHEALARDAFLHLLEELHPREDVAGRRDDLARRALPVLVGKGVDKRPQRVAHVEEAEQRGGLVSVVVGVAVAKVHAVRV